MCGVFGLLRSDHSTFPKYLVKPVIEKLFLLSETRGKDASGIALFSEKKLFLYKQPIPASILIKEKKYQIVLSKSNSQKSKLIIGHTRMATNGSFLKIKNNQPIFEKGIILAHNGIIVNDKKLLVNFPEFPKNIETDSEILLRLFDKFWENTKNLSLAITQVFQKLEGSTSMAAFFTNLSFLLLASNTGSLFYIKDNSRQVIVFASQKNYLEKVKRFFPNQSIHQIKAGVGLLLNQKDFSFKNLTLKSNCSKSAHKDFSHKRLSFSLSSKYQHFLKEYEINLKIINQLKRCVRCLLPETMPFIKFDNQGVCNYCHNYQKMEILGEKALRKKVEPFRNNKGETDCIVTFSGGRDSSYGLHYVKNVLKLNPIAYSYDWGMLTDLGRRNQARMCGKLGIEHLLVSADINKKRTNIKNNILAWLKRPSLGVIPLFMAGDKQYFYYANKLKNEYKINLVILCANPYEKTDFKSGFSGIPPFSANQGNSYSLSVKNQSKIFAFYLKECLANPAYLNSSIFDTLFAYGSYYLIPHNYLFLYRYIKWEEDRVNKTLNQYLWERAEDTSSTWRIGDGTAAFYNYIYFTMAGFSEIDTFRSNQIREGIITRKKALKIAQEENLPRFESMEWYCKTIGIDFKNTLSIINSSKKLYDVK